MLTNKNTDENNQKNILEDSDENFLKATLEVILENILDLTQKLNKSIDSKLEKNISKITGVLNKLDDEINETKKNKAMYACFLNKDKNGNSEYDKRLSDLRAISTNLHTELEEKNAFLKTLHETSAHCKELKQITQTEKEIVEKFTQEILADLNVSKDSKVSTATPPCQLNLKASSPNLLVMPYLQKMSNGTHIVQNTDVLVN